MQLKTIYGSKVKFIRFFDRDIIWVDSELGTNHILIEDLDEESKKKIIEIRDTTT